MFLESILFLQKLKIFKNSVALFWRLIRGSSKSQASVASSRVNFGDLFASERSNCERSEEHTSELQSRGLHRDFHGSARDSLIGRTSSREKHLENFFHNFVFECFGGLTWRLVGDSL